MQVSRAIPGGEKNGFFCQNEGRAPLDKRREMG